MTTSEEQEAIRFGTYLRETRESAGLSQVELASRTGINQKTISRWENGITVPNILQARAYMAALGVSPMRSTLGYSAPGLYEGLEQADTPQKLEAIIHYLRTAASPAEVDKLAFLMLWEHGSAWQAMLEMYVADAQVPLLERIGVASLINANYLAAREHERIVFPTQPQPDVDMLTQAIEACRKAVSKNLDAYTQLLVLGKAV